MMWDGFDMLLSCAVGFIAGAIWAANYPKAAEVFRAYTANEEPRE